MMPISHWKAILIFGFLLLQIKVRAQHDSLVHHLLNRIVTQQATKDKFFIKDIFPSYISRDEIFRTKKKDNTIFYNGLIIYTLRKITNQLPEENQSAAKEIIGKAEQPFFRFKNRKGRNTYNFWRTDSTYKFPYTWWIPLLHHNAAPPDDMDDTVLGQLGYSHEDAEELHSLMQQYINHDTANKKSIEKKYQPFGFYSTWFGETFPVVLDVSVLCNILNFVQENNLNWTKADSASLQLIIETINNNDILTRPLFVSPYYGKTSIILYHLARLMSVKEIRPLEELKPKLHDLATRILAKTKNLMEKIILSSALLKWGYAPSQFELPSVAQMAKQIEQNNFPFFIGNIPSYFASGKKRFFTKNKIGLFYHYCPAFNDALLLEYLVLKKKRNY